MPVRPLRSPVQPAVVQVVFRLVVALWLAGSALPARADIQEPIEAHTAGQRLQRQGQRRDTTPANATPQSVQIHQGEAIEIILRARGQIGRDIEFLIRSWPAHGTLEGLPRQLTRDTARITYVHRAGDGPGDDHFTYAVKATGSAVSAAVPVFVTVLDSPPSLAVTPAELDFGAVRTGDSTRATLTLENRGGGVAMGRVEPPVPWIVEGASEYRLAHGETQSFQIVFQPSYGQAYAESEHFRGEEGQGVRLIGTGIGPRDPAADPASRSAASRAAIEAIARDNALARAAENAARPPSAAEASAATRASAATAPGSQDMGRGGGADATPSATVAAAGSGVGGNGALSLPVGGPDSVVLNEAAVRSLEVRGVGTSTLELMWLPPRPTPRAYRVELRYLPLDSDGNLRVDWRPYAKVEVRPTQERVTARATGLPEGTRQYVRVVAVDDAGRLAAPSPTVMIETRVSSTWWHLTFRKVLVASLLLCLGLLIYRKWEEREILRELDESRAARDADLLYKP